jgi:hypothetical protein
MDKQDTSGLLASESDRLAKVRIARLGRNVVAKDTQVTVLGYVRWVEHYGTDYLRIRDGVNLMGKVEDLPKNRVLDIEYL